MTASTTQAAGLAAGVCQSFCAPHAALFRLAGALKAKDKERI